MAVRVAINGFGRTGRAAFRAAYEEGADIEWVAINDVADPAMLAQLLKHDTVYGPFGRTSRSGDGAIVVDGHRIETPLQADPGAASVGRARRRRRDRVDRPLPCTRRRRQAPRGRRREGDRLGSREGSGRDRRARRQLRRSLRPGGAPDHLERLLHDELPRAGGEGPARGLRDQARPDDDRACVHRRPAAARRPAQGLPPRPCRRLQPRPDDDRSGEGARASSFPSSTGSFNGYAVRVPVPTGSLVDLTVEVERPTTVEEVNEAFRRTRRHRRARGHPRLQRGAARLVRHRQVAVLGDLRRAA